MTFKIEESATAILAGSMLLLSGCITNPLVYRESAQFAESREAVAKTFYSLAKNCWQREETAMKGQIIVENVMTVDSIAVSARFNTFTSGVMNPFLKFVVEESGAGASVALYAQEAWWIDREQHLKDASNWMAGNDGCSGQRP